MMIHFEFQIQIDAWILFPWLQLQVSEIGKFDASLWQKFMYWKYVDRCKLISVWSLLCAEAGTDYHDNAVFN